MAALSESDSSDAPIPGVRHGVHGMAVPLGAVARKRSRPQTERWLLSEDGPHVIIAVVGVPHGRWRVHYKQCAEFKARFDERWAIICDDSPDEFQNQCGTDWKLFGLCVVTMWRLHLGMPNEPAGSSPSDGADFRTMAAALLHCERSCG